MSSEVDYLHAFFSNQQAQDERRRRWRLVLGEVDEQQESAEQGGTGGPNLAKGCLNGNGRWTRRWKCSMATARGET